MTDEVSQGRDTPRPPVGGRHRRTLVMAGVVVAFIAVVGIVGVIRGKPDPAPTPSGSPTASPSTTADSSSAPALQLTGVRCAHLDGNRLSVGFGVVNSGPDQVTINGVSEVFPLGGLTAGGLGRTDVPGCPTTPVVVPATLEPNAEVVFSLVLTPADPRCIGPLPVDVGLVYAVGAGPTTTENLHAFPDLGNFGLPSECSSPSG